MSAHTMPELYETLTAGGKFSRQFSCKQEAIEFRNKLATHKYRKERELKLMGVIEPLTLAMDYDLDTNVATYYTRAREQRELTTYEILTISPQSPQSPDPDTI